MRCRECEAVLWGYVDRELAPSELPVVEAHLRECARCAAALERVRAFPLHALKLRCAAPPLDFTERLMRRIESLPTPREYAPLNVRGGARRQLPMIVLAVSASAAAVLLGLLSTSLFALVARDLAAGQAPLDVPSLTAIGLADLTKIWSWFNGNSSMVWSALVVLGLMVTVLTLLWQQLLESGSRGERGH